MKSSTQVIRVSAPRSSERSASLSSWLDGVQVRMVAPIRTGEAGSAPAESSVLAGSAAAAAVELTDLVIRKIL